MDAVALASVITSGVVGVSGIGAALWTSRQSVSLAREARTQQRLADAYVDVLGSVEREGRYLQYLGKLLNAKTDLSYDERVPQVSKPDASERSRAAALLGAFGSRRVKQLYEDWLVAVAAIDEERSLVEWNWEQEGGDPNRPINPGTLRNLLERLEPAESTARDALSEAVARELGHR